MPQARIPEWVLVQLEEMALASPREETCALIGRHPGGRFSLYLVANVAPRPAREFLMDARGQFGALREMRRRGERLYAIHHSHPRGPARPSATDRTLAAWPGTFQLITSLTGRRPRTTAWWFDARRLQRVRLSRAGGRRAGRPARPSRSPPPVPRG